MAFRPTATIFSNVVWKIFVAYWSILNALTRCTDSLYSYFYVYYLVKIVLPTQLSFLLQEKLNIHEIFDIFVQKQRHLFSIHFISIYIHCFICYIIYSYFYMVIGNCAVQKYQHILILLNKPSQKMHSF